jgi:hypothetical protein
MYELTAEDAESEAKTGFKNIASPIEDTTYISFESVSAKFISASLLHEAKNKIIIKENKYPILLNFICFL